MNNNLKIPALLLAFLCAGAAACYENEELRHAGKCRAIAGRFDAVLAAAAGSCRTDADCGCYGAVSSKARCGGITDRKTADMLGQLEAQYWSEKCPREVRCAPWACRPVCARGRCANAR